MDHQSLPEARAFRLGWAAHNYGDSKDSNPNRPGKVFNAWLAGWKAAERHVKDLQPCRPSIPTSR